ncbi:hypothetical protein KM043_002476 [Ampulex compressa]|nr:hypothetical protein KM043_002476 [Ampulex compressa]
MHHLARGRAPPASYGSTRSSLASFPKVNAISPANGAPRHAPACAQISALSLALVQLKTLHECVMNVALEICPGKSGTPSSPATVFAIPDRCQRLSRPDEQPSRKNPRPRGAIGFYEDRARSLEAPGIYNDMM